MSDPRYKVERAAVKDLEESVDYLRVESTTTAHRFLDACEETFERITDFPAIGFVYEPLDARLNGVRVFRVKGFERWLVFYRPVDRIVQIERVLHSARDIPRLLFEP